ncbi:hypothetical protein GCM10020255_004250 [Rhodococcus baikonurensis]
MPDWAVLAKFRLQLADPDFLEGNVMTAITEYTLGNFDANYAAVEVPDTDGVRLVLPSCSG